MTTDLLKIPAFLRRDPANDKKTRKTAKSSEKAWSPGIPAKRPTRAQYATLSKRGWGASQVARLVRSEAAAIIELGVSPEARFAQDKKHQFPGSKDDG